MMKKHGLLETPAGDLHHVNHVQSGSRNKGKDKPIHNEDHLQQVKEKRQPNLNRWPYFGFESPPTIKQLDQGNKISKGSPHWTKEASYQPKSVLMVILTKNLIKIGGWQSLENAKGQQERRSLRVLGHQNSKGTTTHCQFWLLVQRELLFGEKVETAITYFENGQPLNLIRKKE